MAKRKGSLLRQLTLNLGLAIVFLSLASFYYQYEVEKRILIENIRTDLMDQGSLLQVLLSRAKKPEDRVKIAEDYIEAAKLRQRAGQQIVIVDAEGKTLAENTGAPRGRPYWHPTLAEAVAGKKPVGRIDVEGRRHYEVAIPCYADPSQKTLTGAILLRQPLTQVADLAGRLMLWEFAVLAITLVIIVIVVHYVLRAKVHKPMQAIFMQEYRIREGDLATIEAEDPRNEFSDLYGMYNEMVLRIAEQKKAILDQKDHVALARLVRQAVTRLTGPLDEILSRSRTLLESGTSLTEEDQNTLKNIIGNVTRIVRELKGIVVEGSKSAAWLQQEAEKIREYKRIAEGDDEDEREEEEAED